MIDANSRRASETVTAEAMDMYQKYIEYPIRTSDTLSYVDSIVWYLSHSPRCRSLLQSDTSACCDPRGWTTCVVPPPIAHRGAGITAPTKTQAAVRDKRSLMLEGASTDCIEPRACE